MEFLGKSNAFAISKKLGLSDNILKNAAKLIDTDIISIEDLIKSIEDSKITIENEKMAILQNSARIEELKNKLALENEQLETKQKEIINKARIEARNLLLDAKEEADAIIKDLQANTPIKELYHKRNKLNDNIKDIQGTIAATSSNNKDMPIDVKDIIVGMNVFVSSLNANGVVLSLPNKSNKVFVQCGSISSNIDISKLFSVKDAGVAYRATRIKY